MRFTSSIGFDGPIARHVVKINMAHMLALARSREVSSNTAAACLAFLSKLQVGKMRFDRETEDFHHMLEQDAIRNIGMETAGYLNLGKSRNDQVSTAIRMEARERALEMVESLVALQETIIAVRKASGRLVIPGYTHLQHAQPITLAHHFDAYFHAFQRDVERMREAFARVNVSPMGSAALAGTSVKVSRSFVEELLGFDGITENSIDAVASRDFVVELLSCLAITMIDFSRLSEELIIWNSKEFGFVEIADEYAATSSIMPQKKNPVVAETIRAKCGSVLGQLTAACSILKALPNAYNLDLQEVTPHLWGAFSDTLASSHFLAEMLLTLKFNASAFKASMTGDMSTATELANYLVREHGIPFRDAHAMVGELVSVALAKNLALEAAAAEELQAISFRVAKKRINVDKSAIKGVLDATKTLELIESEGGANPARIQSETSSDLSTLKSNLLWIKERKREAERADKLLESAASHYIAEARN